MCGKQAGIFLLMVSGGSLPLQFVLEETVRYMVGGVSMLFSAGFLPLNSHVEVLCFLPCSVNI